MNLILQIAPPVPARVVIFPAAFHPPTIAHEALIRAARRQSGAVLLTLARELPHKSYDDVGFNSRLQMVMQLAASLPGTGVAVSAGGLFHGIAQEAREHFPDAALSILCGRDAAERALSWDYGADRTIEEQLSDYSLLVASRGGELAIPARLARLDSRIERLDMEPDWDAVSATEVRRRIAAGEPWQALVPSPIARLVEDFYS